MSIGMAPGLTGVLGPSDCGHWYCFQVCAPGYPPGCCTNSCKELYCLCCRGRPTCCTDGGGGGDGDGGNGDDSCYGPLDEQQTKVLSLARPGWDASSIMSVTTPTDPRCRDHPIRRVASVSPHPAMSQVVPPEE